MKRYHVPEISAGVFSVGVKDWNRRLFDALIPTPQGTTYNSYLIKGKNKNSINRHRLSLDSKNNLSKKLTKLVT